MSHFLLFHWIMIQIFIVHTTSEAVVRGVIGQPVQLPCFYRVARHKDISDMCWGRGPCPNSKCNNKILHTTGNRVTFRKSERYSLRGYISYGDVSLTIGKVKAEDAGTYCCRIEIPGWFNDIKHNMRLEVVRAPPVITTTTRKAPVSRKRFRKTTFAPQATTDHQTTSEAAVLLTTTVPDTTATTDHQTTSETAVLLTTTVPDTTATTDHQTTSETAVLLTTTVPDTTATTDHQTTSEAAVLLTTTVPDTTATTDHQTTAETAVLLTTTVPDTTATTDHQTTSETAVLLTTTVPDTTATTDHQTTAETAVLLTTSVPEATTATTDHQATAETAVLLTTSVPEATTATTDHQATAETAFLLTTSVPEATTATTDYQVTAETAVLLTTTVPDTTTATTKSSAVITLETIAPSTFAVTANDTFPAAMVTTSALADFRTGFQAADMRTEDDDMFCSAQSVPLPGGAKVTTEFPSTLLTAEGTKSAHTSPMVKDMPTAATTPPAATMLQTPKRTLAPSGISTSSDSNAEKPDDNGDKFPSYAILIACVIAVSIFLILMLSSLFWKPLDQQKTLKKFSVALKEKIAFFPCEELLHYL
ncbi:hepatitis A virus cellular receptor 1 isoform X2 [Phalacrocorax carbo]|uniref:hepatitis A virus cellular receptor 1 isoform X2 n=1 Tax=Phalacrocorax carbo TaxID=9209 RepID=UPI00311911B8